MTQLKGKRGIVHSIKKSGDLLVSYRGNGFVINPAAVVKVRGKLYDSCTIFFAT